MKREAEAHATEDAKIKEDIEIKNIADQAIYTAEKALRDGGDKVPADVKTDVEAKIADVKKAKEGTDIAAIKKATEDLSLAMQKIGEADDKGRRRNKATNPQQTAEEETVRDADFKEKK